MPVDRDKNGIVQGNQPLFMEGNGNGILLLHGFISGPHEMKMLPLKESFHVLTMDVEKEILYREIIKFARQVLYN